MKQKLTRFRFALLTAFAVGIASAYAAFTSARPIPDPKQDAMQRASALYTALKAKNFDSFQIDLSLMYLPDQDFSEDPKYHGRALPAFAVPHLGTDFYKGQVAFYSTVFSRMNRGRVIKDGYEVHPDGFYIVCDWDGKVSQVETNNVLQYKVSGTNENPSYMPVFPCMREYAHGVRLW